MLKIVFKVLNISEETQALRDAGIICDLFEREMFHIVHAIFFLTMRNS